ncbi:glycosyltransferase [Roseomonas sp. NAR14]|uniref:Glycosyltransferase n=1 Tax=Roseomonas acroporae TaxID=2937791 RepID=A0A9X1Y6C5_9PROT|nr:glycosyltransferase [Roseomonas acroporae]MCK8785074.1 glycosyltransferase [Roseomonas acroporae]
MEAATPSAAGRATRDATAHADPGTRADARGGPAAPPLVSVVVPVRNEAPNILPLVAEIEAALAGVPHEIVYVDDGSTDETPARLAEAARQAPLRFLRHRASCGQSAAVVSGVKAARGRFIATLDGDGQNDPADIPALLARAQAAAEGAGAGGDRLLVAGHRTKRRDTWTKRISSRIANRVRARLLGDATPDTGCGLKLFPRALFLDLPHFDHMHRFLPALVLRAGGQVVSVPVNHRPRLRGASNYGTLDRLAVGVFDLFGVAWLQRRGRRPEIEAAGGAEPAAEAPGGTARSAGLPAEAAGAEPTR